MKSLDRDLRLKKGVLSELTVEGVTKQNKDLHRLRHKSVRPLISLGKRESILSRAFTKSKVLLELAGLLYPDSTKLGRLDS